MAGIRKGSVLKPAPVRPRTIGTVPSPALFKPFCLPHRPSQVCPSAATTACWRPNGCRPARSFAAWVRPKTTKERSLSPPSPQDWAPPRSPSSCSGPRGSVRLPRPGKARSKSLLKVEPGVYTRGLWPFGTRELRLWVPGQMKGNQFAALSFICTVSLLLILWYSHHNEFSIVINSELPGEGRDGTNTKHFISIDLSFPKL